MSASIERAELVAEILKDRSESLLVVCGLGSSTYDVSGVEDHPKNFYLWGAMGQALSVGLGISIAQTDMRVLVITGDGEMLMGLGSLSNRPLRLAVRTLRASPANAASLIPEKLQTVMSLPGLKKPC